MTDFNTLLEPLAEIAREAGDAILAVYERDDLGVETKDDKSVSYTHLTLPTKA